MMTRVTCISFALCLLMSVPCSAVDTSNPFGQTIELTPPEPIRKLPPLSKNYRLDRSNYTKALYSKMPEGVFRTDTVRGGYHVSQFISLGGGYWVEAFQLRDGKCAPMLFRKVAQTGDSIVLQSCSNHDKSVEIFKDGKITLTLKKGVGPKPPCIGKPLYQMKWYKN